MIIEFYDENMINYCRDSSKSLISCRDLICCQNLGTLQKALGRVGVSKEEFEKISNFVNFYNFYFKCGKSFGFVFTFFPKDCSTDEVCCYVKGCK